MKVKELTTNALLFAIIAIMATVPQFGFISLFGIPLTLLHIPVLLGALWFPKYAWTYGLVFGLSSWFVALIRPVTPIDVLFQNPLVSVAPRLVFGLLIPVVYLTLTKLNLKALQATAVTAFVMTIVHAILVLSMLALFGLELFGGSQVVLSVIGGILLTNSVPEAILAVVVVTPIVRRLHALFN
jgi:hypothetical protein